MSTTPEIHQNLEPETPVKERGPFVEKLIRGFRYIQEKFEAPFKFFIKHFFKTRFMVSMSKKIQMHGVEKVFNMGPKAFFYFFMFYLIRDTILYIIIPIYLARATGE